MALIRQDLRLGSCLVGGERSSSRCAPPSQLRFFIFASSFSPTCTCVRLAAQAVHMQRYPPVFCVAACAWCTDQNVLICTCSAVQVMDSITCTTARKETTAHPLQKDAPCCGMNRHSDVMSKVARCAE